LKTTPAADRVSGGLAGGRGAAGEEVTVGGVVFGAEGWETTGVTGLGGLESVGEAVSWEGGVGLEVWI